MWNLRKVFGFAFRVVSKGWTVQWESKILSQGFVKKSCEIWIQCDFVAILHTSEFPVSWHLHRRINMQMHADIYRAFAKERHKSDKELALAMPVHLRSTIYSFFRTCVKDMSESAFNLRHLGLLRHVKTINFLKQWRSLQVNMFCARKKKPPKKIFCLF